jgi:hypothetical protein
MEADNTIRVGIFGDWDKTQGEMIYLLHDRTTKMHTGAVYKNLKFVDRNYTHAVVFNYPKEEIKCDPKNVVGLILEPPEILDALYPSRPIDDVPGVGRMFSFCDGTGYPPAYGMGFATAKPTDDILWPPFTEKHACMFVSNKVITPYHQKRQQIYQALLATDLPIDFYGRGMNIESDPRCKGEVESYGKDKILRKYSLCIDFENSPHNVITDKFFDPVLSNAIPITNAKILHTLLPEGGFLYIDFEQSVEQIVQQINEYINMEDQAIDDQSYGLKIAKKSLLDGDLNLTKWIYERIMECE